MVLRKIQRKMMGNGDFHQSRYIEFEVLEKLMCRERYLQGI